MLPLHRSWRGLNGLRHHEKASAEMRSLDRLLSLLRQNLVEESQVVEFREVGHFAPEETGVEGRLGRSEQRVAQWIVSHFETGEGLVDQFLRDGFAGLGLN